MTSLIMIDGAVHPAATALLDGRTDVTARRLDKARDDVRAALAEADGILVRALKLDAALIEAAPRLKAVARHGVGYDDVDVAALTQRGIPLMIVGDANAKPVAEHTMAMMLAVTRQLPVGDRAMRNDDFAARGTIAMTELAGKTVLIVGFGRIGRQVAARCVAFEMRIIAADPFADAAAVAADGHGYAADFREALGQADIVTLHLPANADGSAVFGAAELAAMKPGAYLVNCARGSLIDEAALAAALGDGRLRGAGLDVTRQEPTPPDNPLLALDNVVFSPHNAALTEECFERMGVVSMQNILDALAGTPRPDHVVNREVL